MDALSGNYGRNTQTRETVQKEGASRTEEPGVKNGGDGEN